MLLLFLQILSSSFQMLNDIAMAHWWILYGRYIYSWFLWETDNWFLKHVIAKQKCSCDNIGIDLHTAAAAKSLQSCPTLCNPIDGSPPGFPIPGILQARILEWIASSFSNAWNWKVKVKLLSRVRLLVTPWTAAYQAPLSMGFSTQEYWSGVPLPSPILTYTKL